MRKQGISKIKSLKVTAWREITMNLNPAVTPELEFLSGLHVSNHKHEEDVGRKAVCPWG